MSIKGCFIACFCLSIIPPLVGVDSDPRDMRINITNWRDKDRQTPKVIDDRKNIRIDSVTGSSSTPRSLVEKTKHFNLLETPVKSLAKKLTVSGKRFHWKPLWRLDGIGGPWLPEITISDDKSVVAIIERFGHPQGPFGSRIVMIDTYSWAIINIVELSDHKIERFRFIPRSTKGVCWSAKQKDLKQGNELLVVDLKSGDIENHSQVKTECSGLVVDEKGEWLFFKPASTSELWVYDLSVMSSPVRHAPCATGPGMLTIASGNTKIVLGAGSTIQFFSIPELRKLPREIKLKTNSPIRKIECADSSSMALLLENNEALYLPSGKTIPVTSDASGILFYNPTENNLLVGKKKDDAIEVFTLPELVKQPSLTPQKLRDRTRGDLVFLEYLPHYHAYLIADSSGNLYFIIRKGKKWRKHIVLTPQK